MSTKRKPTWISPLLGPLANACTQSCGTVGNAANEAKTKAANTATPASKPCAPTKAEVTTEFNQQVQEKMQSAGVNYGEAWSLVQQTQPRLYAGMMNGYGQRQAARRRWRERIDDP